MTSFPSGHRLCLSFNIVVVVVVVAALVVGPYVVVGYDVPAINNAYNIFVNCVPFLITSPPAPLVPVAVLLVAGIVPALLPPHQLFGAGPPALCWPHENVAIALFTKHVHVYPLNIVKI